MLKKYFFFVILCLILSISTYGQVENKSINEEKRKNKYVFLPATAYTPETGLTAGFLSAIIFDLAKGDTLSRMSQVALLGVITTKKQISTGVDFTLFTPKEQYRFEGRIEYKKDVDRNFGVGNDADETVFELENGTAINAFNYLEIRTNRLELRLGAFRKLRKSLFAGLVIDYRRTWNFEPFENRVIDWGDPYPTTNLNVPVNGTTSGLGVGLAYDTRDNINNAHSGVFVQMRHLFYQSLWGSDYDYYSFSLDARAYFKTTKTQSVALRFLTDQRYHTYINLPLYSLARIGGKEFARGYFEGTYRDNHLLGFVAEYRIPIWQDPNSKFWQFWKRTGIHLFASSSQVMGDWNDFDINSFRAAIGVGGRYVLNFSQRINLRLDLGYGWHKGATIEGRAWGFYFFIGEAF